MTQIIPPPLSLSFFSTNQITIPTFFQKKSQPYCFFSLILKENQKQFDFIQFLPLFFDFCSKLCVDLHNLLCVYVFLRHSQTIRRM